MLSIGSDLRYAGRMLRARPMFTLVAALSLGLGIGANTAIFSMIESSLLRGLPFRDADRLVFVRDHQPCCETASVSPGEYLDYQRDVKSFEGIAAMASHWGTLTGNGQPVRLIAVPVTTNFFEVLGAQAHVGRLMSSAIDKPGTDSRVAVLSDSLWKRQFGADPNVVGRDLTIDRASFRVIGILPPKEAYPHETDVWLSPRLPVPENREGELAKDYDPAKQYGNHWMRGLARLRPGVSIAQARAELSVAAARIAASHPDQKDHYGVLVPMQDELVSHVRPALWVLLAAVVLLLLIACANIAGLLLARAAARGRELAVRVSLGASRWEITRLMLCESLLLAVSGGFLGIGFAYGALRLIQHYTPYDLPPALAPELNLPVLLFSFGVTLLTALLSGLAPSLAASQADANVGLKESSRGSTGHGAQCFRRILVAGEIALSMVLLVGAALLVRSFSRLIAVDPGFDSKNVTSISISLPDKAYDGTKSTRFWERFLSRVSAVPSVEASGVVTIIPFSGNDSGSYIEVQDHPLAKNQEGDYAQEFGISNGTLPALQVPLLEGRWLDDRDHEKALTVALVNKAFAEKEFPNQSAVGKKFRGGSNGVGDGWTTIVGVIGNFKTNSLDTKKEMAMFFPYQQLGVGSASLMIRTKDGIVPISEVRNLLREIDSNLPIGRVRPLDDYVGNSLAQRRFLLGLLMAFSGLAVLLAVIGIYGLMAYSVEQRRRELGVRVALGASRGSVLSLVMKECGLIAVFGAAAGLIGALWASSLVKSLLFQISQSDAGAYTIASLMVLAAAMIAGLVPAIRAARIDPVQALRSE
jgi:putative ABC transport system permease protein